jgi:tetratricopeptide (TPR) repeat protein
LADNPRIEDLRRRLEREPNSRLFAQLAEELRRDGEFEEAIRILRAGLARHPSYPSARMTLGRALFDTGDMAAARVELESVLKGAPDNILASRLLAECLEALGDLEGALGRYRATLALSPGDKQLTARVRALEGKLQTAARPAAPPASEQEAESPPGETIPFSRPIPLAAVDEPMELETSNERPMPQAETAPIPVVEPVREFEIESAYEAPGTEWHPEAATEAAVAPPPAAHQTIDVPKPQTIGSAQVTQPRAGVAPAVEHPAAAAPTLAPAAPPATAPSIESEFEETSFEYVALSADSASGVDLVQETAHTVTPEEVFPAPPARAAPATAVAASVPPRPAAAPSPAPPTPVVAASQARVPAPMPEPRPAPVSAPEPSTGAVPPSPSPGPRELVSPTLAELYLSQGFPERALEVYRALLERDPGNERARVRVRELQTASHAGFATLHADAEHVPAAEQTRSEDERARAVRRAALERTIERLERLRAALSGGPPR